MVVRSRRTGIALFVCLLATATAWADEWDALFTRAIAAKERALDTNDPAAWQDALDLFQQADRVRSTKEVKYELGTAAAKLRQEDLAVEAFEAAIALGIDGVAKDKARAYVDEKAPGLARLIVTGPAGASLLINGRVRGKLPLARPLVVFAGVRSVRARLGEDSAERSLTLAPGTTAAVDFGSTLSQAGAAPPPGPALGPPAGPPVDRPPPARPEPESRALPWALTLGGGGLVLLGGTTVFVAGSNLDSHRSRLADVCAIGSGDDACKIAKTGKKSDAQSEVDAIATWKAVRTGGWVGLGAGVIGMTIGIVMLAGSSDSPRHTVRVVPLSGGGVLGFGGRW